MKYQSKRIIKKTLGLGFIDLYRNKGFMAYQRKAGIAHEWGEPRWFAETHYY